MITKVFAVQCKAEDVSRFMVFVLTAEESLHYIPVEGLEVPNLWQSRCFCFEMSTSFKRIKHVY